MRGAERGGHGHRAGTDLEELFQQVPVLLLALRAGHVLERVHLDVGREVARQDLGVQEPVREVPELKRAARSVVRLAQWAWADSHPYPMSSPGRTSAHS